MEAKKLEGELIKLSKYIKLQFIIEDNGRGISKGNIKKLFTDYMRLDEHQEMNKKGTGLGLSICKNLIEQMGGDVKVESVLGHGTKFKFSVQVKAVDMVANTYLNENQDKTPLINFLESKNAFAYTENFKD